VMFEGSDRASRSAARTTHGSKTTCTVISSISDGAWPILDLLDERLAF
jgi:hypothetical protein